MIICVEIIELIFALTELNWLPINIIDVKLIPLINHISNFSAITIYFEVEPI
jgi:hypothetical protein